MKFSSTQETLLDIGDLTELSNVPVPIGIHALQRTGRPLVAGDVFAGFFSGETRQCLAERGAAGEITRGPVEKAVVFTSGIVDDLQIEGDPEDYCENIEALPVGDALNVYALGDKFHYEPVGTRIGKVLSITGGKASVAFSAH